MSVSGTSTTAFSTAFSSAFGPLAAIEILTVDDQDLVLRLSLNSFLVKKW